MRERQQLQLPSQLLAGYTYGLSNQNTA